MHRASRITRATFFEIAVYTLLSHYYDKQFTNWRLVKKFVSWPVRIVWKGRCNYTGCPSLSITQARLEPKPLFLGAQDKISCSQSVGWGDWRTGGRGWSGGPGAEIFHETLIWFTINQSFGKEQSAKWSDHDWGRILFMVKQNSKIGVSMQVLQHSFFYKYFYCYFCF